MPDDLEYSIFPHSYSDHCYVCDEIVADEPFRVNEGFPGRRRHSACLHPEVSA